MKQEQAYLVYVECGGSHGRKPDHPSSTEDLRTILAVLRSLSQAAITKPRFIGEGILVVTSSANTALGLATRLHEETGRLRIECGVPAGSVRTSIHVGPPPADEEDYLSEPVTVVRALCMSLREGQLGISESARQGLDARSHVPMHRLKVTHDAGTDAWIVDWARRAERTPLPRTLLRDTGTRFVGREREIGHLLQLWEDAVAGAKRITFLVGEPGMGKSRLMAELARHVHASGSLVLAGQCDPARIIPYQPFVEALRELIVASDDKDLRVRMRNMGTEITALVPEIVHRLPHLGTGTRLPTELERHRLFEGLASIFTDSGHRPAIVLCLDDFQWADPGTIALLRYIARRPVTTHLLIVAAYRTEGTLESIASPDIGEIRNEPGVDLVRLQGLRENDVAALAAEWLGAKSSRAAARVLHRVTEGRPFFVEELLRHFADLGVFDRVGSWTRIFEEHELPETLRELVGRRLAHLSPQVLEILKVASVIGPEFDLDRLQRLSGVPEPVLLDLLAEAAAAGLVIDSKKASSRAAFAHALVREVLYEDLPGFKRASIHLSIVMQLESDGGGDEMGELAYHSYAAGDRADPERTVGYALAAGDFAIERLAYEDAARHYDRALETLERSMPSSDSALKCHLLLTLSGAHHNAGDASAAREVARAAIPVARTLDADNFGRAALAFAGPYGDPGSSDDEVIAVLDEALMMLGDRDSPLKAKLMTRLGTELHPRTTWERSQALLTGGVELAYQLGDVDAILYCANYRLHLGAPIVDRVVRADELLRLAEDHASTTGRAAHAVVWAHNQRALAYLEMGDVAAVCAELRAYEASSSRLRVPFHSAFTTLWEATLALLEGDFERAETLSTKAANLGQLAGLPDAAMNHSAQLLAIKWERGEAAEVLASLESLAAALPDLPSVHCALAAAYSDFDRTPSARAQFELLAKDDSFHGLPRDASLLPSLALLAETCAYLADSRRAEALYRLLVPWSSRVAVVGNSVLCHGPVDRALGLLATTRNDLDAAQAHFELALEIAERMGARPSEARTQRDYAAMLTARGGEQDLRMAVDLKRRAANTATALGMRRLKDQLATITRVHARLNSSLQVLTRREREVLVLISQGLPNKAIGRRLGVATKTVSTHVSNILAKLGVGDRTEAAVYAVRQGLNDIGTA